MFERKNYISWDDFFMLQAKLITLRTEKDSSGMGFVIADKNKRVILHSNKSVYESLKNENVLKSIPEDSTIYITDFPSILDAKIITNSKIKNVVFSRINDEEISSVATVNYLFALYEINCRKYQIKHNIVIPKVGPAYIDVTNKSNAIINKTSTTIDNLDDYWIAQTKLIAQRSKDPATQVGSIIIGKNNNVLSLGYNGTPNNFCDEEFPWGKEGERIDTKYLYVCHSELNSIANYFNTIMMYADEPLETATLYVSLFPCNECAKLISQFKIKNIVYAHIKNEDKPEVQASKKMFDKGKIKYTYHELTHDIIIPSDELQLQMKPKSRVLTPNSENKVI